jgi:hypothetical protein
MIMLKFNCEFCKKELTEPGGLIFSPPDENDNGKTFKSHICVACYASLYEEHEKKNDLV